MATAGGEKGQRESERGDRGMLFMGLYCFSGSILYRWRSVMSTARSSALWKRLIWEEQITTVLITHPAGEEPPVSRPAGFCLSVRAAARCAALCSPKSTLWPFRASRLATLALTCRASSGERPLISVHAHQLQMLRRASSNLRRTFGGVGHFTCRPWSFMDRMFLKRRLTSRTREEEKRSSSSTIIEPGDLPPHSGGGVKGFHRFVSGAEVKSSFNLIRYFQSVGVNEAEEAAASAFKSVF
ncbi:hypothetical protein EYF80_024503 [Liparis tanakae]|uniref:Uncharacterized protein n=1 Tax=Liparis tanakae TaxID=230148 RepID=A0A4Z2HHM9_9TELE|nr:hypothetical protein EYF80_024503 [Liparis tanakae]